MWGDRPGQIAPPEGRPYAGDWSSQPVISNRIRHCNRLGQTMETPSTLLTIAGTDPSGGAGLPVDLQVFRDFGYHGLSVVTAVVWQNTVGVGGFESLAPERVEAQLRALFDDLPVGGIKIGMLAAPETAATVAETLRRCAGDAPVVLDPVLSGGGGGERLRESGLVERLRDSLLERVDVVTPNVQEAEALVGRSISGHDAMREAARELVELGAGSALVKAGHLDEAGDTLRDRLAVERKGRIETPELEALPRVDADVRGTGCQLSSAIAAALADGAEIRPAVETARRYVNDLLRERAAPVGGGRAVVVRTDRDGGDIR